MALSQLADIRQELEQSRRQTLRIIERVDEATALRQPRPDAWSVKDHVAHLTAVDESVTHFARRMLNEDCPISPLYYDKAFSQDSWNKLQVAQRAGLTWAETLVQLKQTRQKLLALLDHIPEESLSRVGSHPMWGTPVTLSSVLRIPYRHERAHRDEIAVLCGLKQVTRSG